MSKKKEKQFTELPRRGVSKKKNKTHRIERYMFKSCLFLKDFEPTLTSSPECAIILCGILSISFWLYSIFNSIKYSLDQVLQHRYALWVYCWLGYRVFPSISDFLPIYLICWLSMLTTRHKWRYFGIHRFGNLVGFFWQVFISGMSISFEISNWIVFSISKNIVFSIYPELFSDLKLNSGICQITFFYYVLN